MYYSPKSTQNFTRSLPSSPQTTLRSTSRPLSASASRSLPSSPQTLSNSKRSSTPSRSSVIRALNFGDTSSHALVSTPSPIKIKGKSQAPSSAEKIDLNFGVEELIAGLFDYYYD